MSQRKLRHFFCDSISSKPRLEHSDGVLQHDVQQTSANNICAQETTCAILL